MLHNAATERRVRRDSLGSRCLPAPPSAATTSAALRGKWNQTLGDSITYNRTTILNACGWNIAALRAGATLPTDANMAAGERRCPGPS